MKTPRFRIIACVLLLVSLIGFSGAAQASLLLIDSAAAHDTCCPPVDNQPSGDPAAPCSSPECQCLGCSGAIFHAHIRIPDAALASTAGRPCDPEILLSGFTTPIDYPPESV